MHPRKNIAQIIPESELDALGFFPKDERNLGEAFSQHRENGNDPLGITISGHGSRSKGGFDERKAGLGRQISLLFKREVRNVFRDTSQLAARFGLTTFMSTLIGVIFFQVGNEPRDSQTNIQSQFGALIMVQLMSMFGTALPSLVSFPQDRPVFLREYSTNHYSVVSYFLSRLSMEASITAIQVFEMTLIAYNLISFQGSWGVYYITMYTLAMASTALGVTLGCSVEDPKIALEMLPTLFIPQILFSGFFIVPDLIPVWLRWLRYVCTLTYSVRILLVEEFQDCADREKAEEIHPPYCTTILTNTDAADDETWWNWLVLAGLFVVFRFLALAILQRKATKFY